MILQKIIVGICVIYLYGICHTNSEILFRDDVNDVTVRVDETENDGIFLYITQGNVTKISGHLGAGMKLGRKQEQGLGYMWSRPKAPTLAIADYGQNVYYVIWLDQYGGESSNFSDCFDLNSKEFSWYGGPETASPEWPIEKAVLRNKPMVTSKTDNGAIVWPYWFNSKGGFIFGNEYSNTLVDQNNEFKDQVCFKGITAETYDDNLSTNGLSYILAVKPNAKIAHQFALNNIFGRLPTEVPNEKMVKQPIWSTWGKYKADISDEKVLAFVKDIHGHGFTEGQIEIDDKWEKCYGDLIFDEVGKFSKVNETIKAIHDLGYRVTLWLHPFVNVECQASVEDGLKRDVFVKSRSDPFISWWNGNKSYLVDFTNSNATQWFLNRLFNLKMKHGIDGFKFDAGEGDWLPQKPLLHTYEPDYTPENAYTRAYLYAALLASPDHLVEVKTGWGTQYLPLFVRMQDKDSTFSYHNGLNAVVRSLLQFNMIGYTNVLPDYIGGNGYNGYLPTPELLVRWTQANTFMPAMQFSYLPWDLQSNEFNTTEIVRNCIKLHSKYSEEILNAMRQCVKDGTPVNPPIWWVDPEDRIAQQINDEFLLGEKILAAPVLTEGAINRDVYLPAGKWKDGNTGKTYEGRQTLKDYPAPIDVLPYFIKID